MNDTPKIIALLTDFGTRDYFVGAMKGVILSVNANAQIVDITHAVAPQDINSAGFILRACYRNFPPQTVFVAVVDPGVGSERQAILVETDDYFFIAPDNGLLSFIFNETVDFKVFALTNKDFFAANISATFHGRDVFAPAAAYLSKGAATNLFGAQTKNYVTLQETKPRRISPDQTEAAIIHIDRFGNLVTNLTSADLPAKFMLKIGETTINKQVEFFAQAARNELLMIFGSTGRLEIIAFQNSAQKLLNAVVGQKIIVSAA